jgi:hypothetical protein
VKNVLPALGQETVAIDNKTAAVRAGQFHRSAPEFGIFRRGRCWSSGLRQAEGPTKFTGISELLSTMELAGYTVTIDAMGTQTAIAEVIQHRSAS